MNSLFQSSFRIRSPNNKRPSLIIKDRREDIGGLFSVFTLEEYHCFRQHHKVWAVNVGQPSDCTIKWTAQTWRKKSCIYQNPVSACALKIALDKLVVLSTLKMLFLGKICQEDMVRREYWFQNQNMKAALNLCRGESE